MQRKQNLCLDFLVEGPSEIQRYHVLCTSVKTIETTRQKTMGIMVNHGESNISKSLDRAGEL